MSSVNKFALVASLLLFNVYANPVEKRQDATTTSLAVPSVGVIVVTSGSTVLTVSAENPAFTPSESESMSTTVSTTVGTIVSEVSGTANAPSPARTGQPPPLIPSKSFPQCHDMNMPTPFCLPIDDQEVYVDETYYVTWNPAKVGSNATVEIVLNYSNETERQAWSSGKIDNSWGYAAVKMEKDWLQTFQRFNLTFFIMSYENGEDKAEQFEGPLVQLRYAPPRHLPPPPQTKLGDKESLMIGLPAALGGVLLIVGGLFFGMRKQRRIGLGNIMGRKRGYGTRQSRRQRMGLGKKGAIQLDERELQPRPHEAKYQDDADEIRPAPIRSPGHERDVSLGSLVSDGGNQINGGRNVFRSEIERQRTGR